jgi:hypothetical protein
VIGRGGVVTAGGCFCAVEQTLSPISRTHAPLYGTATIRPELATTPPDQEKFPEPVEPKRAIALVIGSNSRTEEERQGMPYIRPFGASTPPAHLSCKSSPPGNMP